MGDYAKLQIRGNQFDKSWSVKSASLAGQLTNRKLQNDRGVTAVNKLKQ